MAKKYDKKYDKVEYNPDPGRSKKQTASGRERNRKPKYLRVHQKQRRKDNKKYRPNKRKRWEPRPGQWKCVCGVWNVDELLVCEKCGREQKIEESEEEPVLEQKEES